MDGNNEDYISGGMHMEKKGNLEKYIALAAFIIMILTNVLANMIPINGFTTWAISDLYPALISPAQYTFLIWIIIYLLLFVFVIYQLGASRRMKIRPETLRQVTMLFTITSLLNSAWIIAWHYEYIAFSLMTIITMLLCLISINKILSSEELTNSEKLIIRLPFSVYFGWITLSSVCNATVLLVSIRWRGFGISETIWTLTLIMFTFIVATFSVLKDKNIAYCFTVIWGFIGILVNHCSPKGFNGQYPAIIVTVIIALLLLSCEPIYLYFSNRHSN